MTGGDIGAIFSLSDGGVLFLDGDSGEHPVRYGRGESHQSIGLSARFIFASADNTRRFQIEFRQIGASFPTLRIQFHGAFKGGANLLGESRRGKKSRAVSLLSINATEPEIVKALLRIEVARALAGSNAPVPLLNHEVRAAKQVVGFCVVGSAADLLLQRLNRLIRVTGRKKFLG